MAQRQGGPVMAPGLVEERGGGRALPPGGGLVQAPGAAEPPPPSPRGAAEPASPDSLIELRFFASRYFLADADRVR